MKRFASVAALSAAACAGALAAILLAAGPADADDGTTFDYEKGEQSWYELIVTKEGRKLKGAVIKSSGDYPRTFGKVTWKFMTK